MSPTGGIKRDVNSKTFRDRYHGCVTASGFDHSRNSHAASSVQPGKEAADEKGGNLTLGGDSLECAGLTALFPACGLTQAKNRSGRTVLTQPTTSDGVRPPPKIALSSQRTPKGRPAKAACALPTSNAE